MGHIVPFSFGVPLGVGAASTILEEWIVQVLLCCDAFGLSDILSRHYYDGTRAHY
jgi:hypothetical protein